MNLSEIAAPDFDLAMTLDSGQVFHWEKIGNGFAGTIGDTPAYIEQCDDVLKVRDGGTPTLPDIVAKYFSLDHPLPAICASLPDDPIMNAARDHCRGLRVIRQPKWECLATFITSSMKQVAHIRQIAHALRRRFGKINSIDEYDVYSFPTALRLAQSSEEELRACALGYRAKNLLATARSAASGHADLEAWSSLSDADLRMKLRQLPGVGSKVANCVMLFAYERLAAFPIDVWIERVLKEQYFPRARKITAERLRIFSETYFGENGGYAQQYLFHHARTASRKMHLERAASANRTDSSRGELSAPRTSRRRQRAPLQAGRHPRGMHLSADAGCDNVRPLGKA